MPSNVMYDSTNAAGLPADAQIVAGYVDGEWPSYPAMVARFPNAQHVSITITAKDQNGQYVEARVLDVENGDAVPADAPGWAQTMRSAGIAPCVYCSRLSAWPDVQIAFRDAFVAPPDYWIADYTNAAHLVQGSVATQWHDFGQYDESLTNGVWPGAAPAPPPPTPPSTQENETMTEWADTDSTGAVTLRHIAGVIGNTAYHWWQPPGGLQGKGTNGSNWYFEAMPV